MPKHALVIYSDPEHSKEQSKALADSLADGVRRRGWDSFLLPVNGSSTYESIQKQVEDLIADTPDIKPGMVVLLHGTSDPAVVEALSVVSYILAQMQRELGSVSTRFQFMHYTAFTHITPDQWEAIATAETLMAGISLVLKGGTVEEERLTDTAPAAVSEVEHDGCGA